MHQSSQQMAAYQPQNTPNSTLPPQCSIVPQSPMPSTEPQDALNSIKIQNCVATVNLGCDLNLRRINFQTRNSEYNPSRFHGVIMRIREPRCTALIFRSGKLVCTGARNEIDANLGTRKFARILQKLGYPVRCVWRAKKIFPFNYFYGRKSSHFAQSKRYGSLSLSLFFYIYLSQVKFMEFKIQNLVATVDLRFPIRLEHLNQMHGQFSSYEPELFPGLIYRMVKPRVVLLVFVNGKIVFTGAKNKSEIRESLENIFPILQSFRKN